VTGPVTLIANTPSLTWGSTGLRLHSLRPWFFSPAPPPIPFSFIALTNAFTWGSAGLRVKVPSPRLVGQQGCQRFQEVPRIVGGRAG